MKNSKLCNFDNFGIQVNLLLRKLRYVNEAMLVISRGNFRNSFVCKNKLVKLVNFVMLFGISLIRLLLSYSFFFGEREIISQNENKVVKIYGYV